MSRSLAGLCVLDLSRVVAGPYCTMVLGDLGAEVVKVERPGRGDDLRGWGPPFTPDGESAYFLCVNRNKRSITLNLKHPEGQRILRALARDADVLIENYKPDTLDALGLGYDALVAENPRLVYCSITAFGSRGPLRDLPGYDTAVQALCGLMSITGPSDGPPTKVGVAIVDVITALYAVTGILAALQARERTGRGQRVEINLLEAGLSALVNAASNYLIGGVVPQRLGNDHPSVTPNGTYPTADGYIVLAIGNEGQWQRFCATIGLGALADDPRFATNAVRLPNRAALDALLTPRLRQRPTAEWVRLLRANAVPCGEVYGVDEILEHPHVRERGTVRTVEHPSAGALRVVGSPLRLSHSSTEPQKAPPRLGEDTEAILAERLGLDAVAIARLREQGAL